jgi:phage protein D
MSKRDRTYTGKSGLPPGFWLSPSELAAKTAAEAHPEISDRAIAEETGIGHATISRARKKSTVLRETVEKRTGRARKPKRAKTAATAAAKTRRTYPGYVIDGLTYADLLAQSRAVLSGETKARQALLHSARAARQLVRRELADGPKPGADIEAAAAAAAIPADVLMVAVDVLRVVTRRGEWRLPR